ncbi:MAG: class I SAM-dependent methyltransferase [Proteobacteria bacterium]|jgi:SAM-dependent methyltransferase|nr:class I SAM-dependent methyltransferase [Pseudomonadota bacterium]
MTNEKGFAQAKEVWDERFRREGFLFGEEPNQYLVSQAATLTKRRALLVADGEGRNSVWLAKQGFDVDAFDISSEATEKARAFAAKSGVQVNYYCCEYRDFDWRATHYDSVVGIFFQFASPAMRSDLFLRISQCLKPGGTLLIQGYTPKQLDYKTGGPGKLDHLYVESTIKEGFQGYDWLDFRLYEDELSEGAGHFGRSALLGAVGRKPISV